MIRRCSFSIFVYLSICQTNSLDVLLSGEEAYLVELFLSLADAAVEGLLHQGAGLVVAFLHLADAAEDVCQLRVGGLCGQYLLGLSVVVLSYGCLCSEEDGTRVAGVELGSLVDDGLSLGGV